jgi:hypothetical protein
MPPGKKQSMQKSVMNLDNPEKCFRFYDKEKLPTAKKLTLELRYKINYSSCVSFMNKTVKITAFKYRKTNDGNKFLWKEEALWLLVLSSFGQFITLQFQEINALNSI